jgi:hypothetical protein
MIYKLDDIVRDVRIVLGDNASAEALFEESDLETLSLDECIRSKVVEAVRRIESEAPAYLLEGGHSFGDAIYWEANGRGWIILPDDFMRLVVFEMDDWERPVYSAVMPDTPEYAKLRSRFKGIGGTPQRPAVAIGIRSEGKVLEFYSCKSTDARLARAMYRPYPSVDEDGGIDMSERCYSAVVYETAALTTTAYGLADKSQQLETLAKSALT